MKILGIETSCDETAMAILEIKGRRNPCFSVLSSTVSSQVELHAKYGGVYPMLAKREHQRNLAPVLIKALTGARLLNSKFKIQKLSLAKQDEAGDEAKPQRSSKLQFKIQNLNKSLSKKIDLIAVTVGPGLEPCLWTGINFAKDLAQEWKKPIVPINHIEAHIVANLVRSNLQFTIFNFQKLFPAVCLVVSGGHTQLVLMTPIRKASFSNGVKKNWKYKIIGQTRDDAAGECFDKTARILGLSYPGGPAIAAAAASLKPKTYNLKPKLPRPMIYQKNYDFSFSGLKTAVLYDFKNRSPKIRKSKQYIQEMAAEIQQAIIDVLIKKTIKASKDHKAKSIILSGGVAANKELRKQLENKIKNDLPGTRYLKPDIKLCTDNAVMIALAGYFNKNKKKSWKEIKANANLRID